jgi:osmotically-inducible protein OsmY
MPDKETAKPSAPRGGGLKDFFTGLFTGIFLCALVGGYFVLRKKPAMRHAQDATAAAIADAVTKLDAKLEAWHLTTRDIERELTQTGKVVRRQMSDFGTAIADAASDTKITATVKAKLALDKELNTFGIGVTTTDGRVTLTGNVTTAKQISRAIMLALETEGVREVSSTLRVKPAL